MWELIILLALLTLGFVSGSVAEHRHLRSLDEREAQNGDFLVSQLKIYSQDAVGEPPPALIVGEAVIATDYMKSFLARLRKIFGGELRSYQPLLTRARREALQRIVDQARRQGYNAICNLRFETADVGGNTHARRVATVAMLATATAYRRQS